MRERIALGTSLPIIAEEMMERCLASDSEVGGVGCDNMTVILIAYVDGKSKENWYDVIQKRVEAANKAHTDAQAEAENAPSEPSPVLSPFDLRHTLLSSPSDTGSASGAENDSPVTKQG